MPDSIKDNQEDDFKWGPVTSISTSNRDIKYYKSFTLRGVEYSLYDCVCMFREGAKETDIGKLIKMWGNKQEKRVKILWFFRPIDIRSFLGDHETSWNELFLASGEGKGLFSVVPLEAIVGKCTVICTSEDSRNTVPSKSDLGKAEYFFSHTFDVKDLKISEKFPDKIDIVRVENLFNRAKDKSKANVKCITGVAGGARQQGSGNLMLSVEKHGQVKVGAAETKAILKDSVVTDETSRTSEDFKQQLISENQPLNNLTLKDSILKDETSRTSEDFQQNVSENQPLKKRKIRTEAEADNANIIQSGVEDPKSILDPIPSFGAKSPPNNLFNSYNKHQTPSDAIADKETSRPKRTAEDKGTRSWFRAMPWEKKLQNADEGKTLIWLDNLDPSVTSSDVKDMILKAFEVETDARIISSRSFSSPPYGQALVVFNSKDVTDFVLRKLREKCLMIGGRPVVASRKHLGQPDKFCRFPGHLIIEKLKKRQWSEDRKNMVSTAHCAQPNTGEYNLATDWRILQAKSDIWWKDLHKKQAKELSECENELKRDCQSSEITAKEKSHDVWKRAS